MRTSRLAFRRSSGLTIAILATATAACSGTSSHFSERFEPGGAGAGGTADGENAGAGGASGAVAGVGGLGGGAGTSGSSGTSGSAGNPPDAGTAGQGGFGLGGSAGDGGAAGSGGQQLPSEFCGDGIRDPITEECDDGNTTDTDSCSDACRIQPAFVVPGAATPPRGRSFGEGRHPVSVGSDGFAVVYVEERPEASVWLQPFDHWGNRLDAAAEVSSGTSPTPFADPVVAAMPNGRYAVAWTERSGVSPDVVVRLYDPVAISTAPASVVHSQTSGTQSDPDAFWTGSQLVVAWTDANDIYVRRYSSGLAPLGSEVPVAATNAHEGAPSLAAFDGDVAAAWRSIDLSDGSEAIRVRAGTVDWSVDGRAPGPAGDRPALMELDPSHLLLVFTDSVALQPGGPPNTGRLRIAVLDTQSPGATPSMPLAAMTDPYASDPSLSQSRPTALRVGSRIFVGWETESPAGNPSRDQVMLQELAWSASDPSTVHQLHESVLSYDTPDDGVQRRPALAASPLYPDGALVTAWEDHTGLLAGRPDPEILMAFRPVPFVELAPPGGE